MEYQSSLLNAQREAVHSGNGWNGMLGIQYNYSLKSSIEGGVV